MIRKFIPYYKPYKKVFLIDLLCAAGISAVDLAYPQFLRSISSTLFTRDSETILRALPLLLIGLISAYILQTFCTYYTCCQGHIMGAEMERDMRKELFEHYEKLSFSYYDKNNSGQMMSRLISDLFDISEMAHHGPENLFISAIKLIGAFIFLFMIQWKLSLALFIMVVLMLLFSKKINVWMKATFARNRQKVGAINATLQNSFSGIRIVQAFVNEDVENEKFRIGNDGFLESKIDNYHAMGTFQAGNTFFTGMMYVIVLVYGGYLIAVSEMQPADLAMFALYIGVFVQPIKVLIELTEMLQKGMSGFKRFLDVIETAPEIKDSENAAELDRPDGDIVFDHVSFQYDIDEDVLNDISFTIKAGRSVALVGPSGGGKSTICSLLPRFYEKNSGSITIGGQEISGVKLSSLRSAIGIVQQDVYLFDGTVYENIAYGRPDASEEEVIEAAKKANIHDFITELPQGYRTIVGERGSRLSGGQKQRISIARVFLKNPPILILDEATSALDNESEQYIQHSLDELAKDRTTITIAHRLSTIKNADEILVIKDHGIMERGSHDELMKLDGVYAAYYRLQFR
ncbi:MAG: ABC transporter ATP-binding protein [Clostridiales bacterium]|nr:ABC transporter ATP-binding protein [Clostridiales bacterium]